MARKAEWFYLRTGCTACSRASGFLEAGSIDIDEKVPASRKLQAEDARTLLTSADRLIVMKGKQVAEFDLTAGIPDGAVEAMLGPTGNLRAPTIRTDRLLLVGFNDQVFNEVFG